LHDSFDVTQPLVGRDVPTVLDLGGREIHR